MKKLFFGVFERLWVGAVLLFQIFTVLFGLVEVIVAKFFIAASILIRFFVAAPLLAAWVFFRSPRGVKKDRWVAWRLVRAHRLGRKLSLFQMKRLNDLFTQQLIREVSRPLGVNENQIIQWGKTIELVPRKDLEVRT